MPEMIHLASLRALTPQPLLLEFLYNRQLTQQYDMLLPQNYYATVQQQLAQIAATPMPSFDEVAWLHEQTRLRALAAVDRPARVVTPEMPLWSRQWGPQAASPQTRASAVMELKAKATQVSQALGIDAVRALISQIAADQRILAPVREALVALEPALLRLALAEPRFLGDNEHPARCLVVAIVQRSFQYNDEFSSKFKIFAGPVRKAIRALDAMAEPSAQDFEQALKALQTDWQALDQAEQRANERGQCTMAFAQKRQELADSIARDLSQRADLVGAPKVVVDFLFKDWSLVIAHAQLTDMHGESGRIDPGGYLSIVTDLLWSVKSNQILQDLPRLLDIVPRMVAVLRKGLNMLDKDPREAQALFDILLHFHEPALKLRRMRGTIHKSTTQQELTAILQLPKEQDLVIPGQLPSPEAAAQPWLGQREQEAIGFIHDDPDNSDWAWVTRQTALSGKTGSGTKAFSPTVENTGKIDQQNVGTKRMAASVMASAASASQDTDTQAMARAETQLTKLQQGSWSDLYSHRKWRRVKLTWISNNGTLFMFMSYGGRMHSMTRHTLERLLRLGQIRPLEGNAALDKTLKAIAVNTLP
jgi:hypothetical protein